MPTSATSTIPDKALIEEVALVKGVSEAFIEKDWYATQVIKLLTQPPQRDFILVFTGGTALSKAHRLIHRFSEDIDFRVLAPTLDGQNNSQIRKAMSGFKKSVVELLNESFDTFKTTASDYNRNIIIDLDYPSRFNPAEVLRPHIKLELTMGSLQLPSVGLPVSSLVNEVAGQPGEVESIACVDPVENAADKVSALAWRVPSRVRGAQDKQPDLVRHLHDLAMLSEKAMHSPHFVGLVNRALSRDDNRAAEVTGLSVQEKISKAMEILATDPAYPREYEKFVSGMSYAGRDVVPSYATALSRMRILASYIAG
ncbi:nucleotidyl transferase AbiEii/AbiGii toxin family protein [Persicitalea sp.]|uniref:nucleotidyl transferase AbiEii/AbiGii toxin family protein n=1 Tax=Persicitalea sp. TaxID=3100273 RepID=UPI003593396B